MGHTIATAVQLRELAASLCPPLGTLQRVTLHYTDAEAASHACAAWPLLPLVHLAVEDHSQSPRRVFTSNLLQSVGWLTGLTRLHLEAHSSSSSEVSHSDMVGMLEGLQHLQASWG